MHLDDELPEEVGEEEEESQFSIARSMRKSASISLDEPVSHAPTLRRGSLNT